jgi:hypothetical protein
MTTPFAAACAHLLINARTGPVVSLTPSTGPITTSTAFDHLAISLAEPRRRLRCAVNLPFRVTHQIAGRNLKKRLGLIKLLNDVLIRTDAE